jgi:hypothetical protein
MIHYHVWFDLKPEIGEAEGLATVGRFLARLSAGGEAAGFRLLRNKGAAPRSKLPRYHALIEFADDEQLASAMRHQAERGIHHGPHGAVIEAVANFHVEIFATVEGSAAEATVGLHACEI